MYRTLYAAAALAAALVALPAAPAAADAVPGAACTTAGATTTIDTRNGPQTYRCEQRRGEDCPHWHWVYNPGVPHGQWTPKPAGPCPTCSTPPASTPPASTPPASTPPASQPAPSSSSDIPELPTTSGEHRPGLLIAVGVALVLAGVVLLLSLCRPDRARHRRGRAVTAPPAEPATFAAGSAPVTTIRRPSPGPQPTAQP